MLKNTTHLILSNCHSGSVQAKPLSAAAIVYHSHELALLLWFLGCSLTHLSRPSKEGFVKDSLWDPCKTKALFMQVHGWAAWNILKSKRCGPSREGQRTLFELNQLSNSKEINIFFFLFTITQGKERNCLQLWPRSNLIKGLYSYKRTHFHLFIWKRKPWSRDKVVANRGRQRGQRAPLGGQRTMAGTGEADIYIIGDMSIQT